MLFPIILKLDLENLNYTQYFQMLQILRIRSLIMTVILFNILLF